MAKKTKKEITELEPVANCDQFTVSQQQIENCILSVRNQQVMMDRDLAMLYSIDTKRLNEQVKRNIERFPENFRFQLTKSEMEEVVAKCDHLAPLKFSPTLHYVFTEQGVAMLSAVLKSPTAVSVSIKIIEAFVAMRRFLASNAQVFQRLETIEYHQLEMKQHQEIADKRIDEVFKRLDKKAAQPTQGIFYNGQIFDAYVFVNDLIRSAKERIVLIDNYVDDTVLKRLDKREAGVAATIYTRKISEQLQIDIDTHNHQYAPIRVLTTDKAHDRFLIIDRRIYHIGASIKDLGKKIFGFTKMEEPAEELLKRLED